VRETEEEVDEEYKGLSRYVFAENHLHVFSLPVGWCILSVQSGHRIALLDFKIP
jgi:hypothetical protein